MRRTTTLVAFGASFLVFVPVVWHTTEADIPTDGAMTRPAQQTLKVGSSTIAVELDRGLMTAGDQVTVKLTATADMERDVALDLTALKDEGIGGERVANPPVVVGRRAVIVHAAPGGGAATVASFHLGHKAPPGEVSWFDVLVTPSRVHPPSDFDWDETSNGKAAMVGVATWTGNTYDLAIVTPSTLPAVGPFEVDVKITNTTKKPIDTVDVRLGDAHHAGYDGMEGYFVGTGDDFSVDEITSSDGDQEPLAPGATRVVRFTVTPKDGIHHLALEAEAQSYSAGGALDVKAIDTPELGGGAPVALQ